jgi:hypothetical protein
MPSARSSNFKGGGGILRKKDGTVLDIQFTDKNPLWKDGAKPAGKPGDKKSDFHSLFAVLHIQEDGREELSLQPLFVGDADAFEVVLDGRGVKGDAQFSKSSDWFIFLDSLAHPKDGGAGFDESDFPEDPDGLVADYTALRGVRVQFDWEKNDVKTKKLGQRLVKGKDGKPDQKFDREDLVVRSYYGQVEVGEAPKQAPGSKKTSAPVVGKTMKKSTAPAVDIAALAAERILSVLKVAKGNALTLNKLSVKLLQEMANEPETREDVRAWALKADNVKGVEGVNYDVTTTVVSLKGDDDEDDA